jgi:hypothetical protein
MSVGISKPAYEVKRMEKEGQKITATRDLRILYSRVWVVFEKHPG